MSRKYKAIKEIGGYKVGEEIPQEKAEIWLDMYDVVHVELIGSGSKPAKVFNKDFEDKKPEVKSNFMLEDYLGRNSRVVIKNILSDDLNKEQLDNLLIIEQSDKNRKTVIKAINDKLEKIE